MFQHTANTDIQLTLFTQRPFSSEVVLSLKCWGNAMLLCCRLYAYKRGESNKLLSFHHLPVEQKLKSYRTMKVKQNDNSLANVSISHFLANITVCSVTQNNREINELYKIHLDDPVSGVRLMFLFWLSFKYHQNMN